MKKNEVIKWGKLYYPSGETHYEGYAKFNKNMKEYVPCGQGIKYFENGKIKFIGEYNKGPRNYYGPRYFVFGRLFDESGGLWYEGTFNFKRSNLGYPLFEGEKSFRRVLILSSLG